MADDDTTAWHATEGTVLLLEPAGERTCLTGTVVGEHDGHPVVDLGADARGADLFHHLDVVVSSFSPEALWRLHATLRPVDEAEASTLAEVWVEGRAERIQRRLVPRRQIDLPVHLFNLDGDEAWCTPVPGRTIDLGPGGVRVHVAERLPAACDPTLHVTLPDGTEIVALAAVVDVEARDEGFDYRLVFSSIADVDRAILTGLAAT